MESVQVVDGFIVLIVMTFSDTGNTFPASFIVAGTVTQVSFSHTVIAAVDPGRIVAGNVVHCLPVQMVAGILALVVTTVGVCDGVDDSLGLTSPVGAKRGIVEQSPDVHTFILTTVVGEDAVLCGYTLAGCVEVTVEHAPSWQIVMQTVEPGMVVPG